MRKPDNNSNNSNNSKNKEEIVISSYSVNRVNETKSGTVFADITINGVTIYGMRVVEGKNGDFLSFPQNKDKNGKYWNVAYCRLSEKDQNDILAEIQRQLFG